MIELVAATHRREMEHGCTPDVVATAPLVCRHVSLFVESFNPQPYRWQIHVVIKNIPSPRMWQLAQQLIAHEVSRQNPPAAKMVAASRVFNELRQPLCTLIGVTGLRVLLARALTLARAQVRGLGVVTVETDASVIGLDGLRDQNDPDDGSVFLAQLLALLSAFIGESLTMNILLDVWPDLTLNAQSAREETKT